MYKTTNTVNGKIYVGQDTHNNPKYLGSGLLIGRAIEKYGKDKFVKEILETCDSQSDLDRQEIFWIRELDAVNPDVGYNISAGGQGGSLVDPSQLSGENHYLNKMSDADREHHLNTFRRGLNYWTSKGFTTIEEIQNWIRDNETGKNHAHKKNKTRDEYLDWFRSTKIGENFRSSKWSESIRGRNNPIFRGKTDAEIDEWLDKHRRGENAPNAKYTYTITKSDGTVIRTNSLKSTCKELNLNMFTLRKLSEIGLGLRKSFIPRQKEYRGWTVVRCQRNRKVS